MFPHPVAKEGTFRRGAETMFCSLELLLFLSAGFDVLEAN